MGRESRLKRERRQQRAEVKGNAAINQTLPRFGLPGQPQFLVLKPVYADGDPRNDLPPGGLPGRYRVVFTLARPGILPKPETEFSFDADVPGDSHLAITRPAVASRDNPNANEIEVETQTEDGGLLFRGLPNRAGFLGRLMTELDAANFSDAHHKAYRAIACMMSNWSAHLDIPMTIWRTHITAVDTRAVQISVVNPFLAMPLGGMIADAAITAEFRGLIGLYREALENRSSAYQFLCFFKIVEGIRNLRERANADARQKGQQPHRRPSWRVPLNVADFEPWLNAIYPGREWDDMAVDSIFIEEARGRKLNELIDSLNGLRVEVAHALSEQTGIVSLDADEALHIARVNKWLPLMKCIVRRMLKDDFPDEFLSNVSDDAMRAMHVERAAPAIDDATLAEGRQGDPERGGTTA